ncbi:MAG: hypothetical protein IPP08_00340 [Chlorobiota bacterium]|jgi:hypothetical protein|nr:hypothetical protein [Chlorobiota bacterium]QQS66662.1 MAG: hypothetical protein IPP08_00340 [Chlorobiota bacterium]
MEDISKINLNNQLNGLSINENSTIDLGIASKWSKIYSYIILGVGIFYILTIILAGFAFNYFSGFLGHTETLIIFCVLGFVMLLTLLFMYLLFSPLLKFSNNIQNYIILRNPNELENAFDNLRKYYKYQGIMIVSSVVIAFLAVFLIFIIFITGFSGILNQ